MTDLAKNRTQELKAALAKHLPWHGARIAFLALFLLALLTVRSVNLAELAARPKSIPTASARSGSSARSTSTRTIWPAS
jgi:hypothetical protein